MNNIVEAQKEICKKYSAVFSPIEESLMLGISVNTDGITVPINGLRHPPEGNTCGWYIWSGEILLKNSDFFKPMHVIHLRERCPQILKFLALPPGYRFLIDNKGYEDVWFDKKLLNI